MYPATTTEFADPVDGDDDDTRAFRPLLARTRLQRLPLRCAHNRDFLTGFFCNPLPCLFLRRLPGRPAVAIEGHVCLAFAGSRMMRTETGGTPPPSTKGSTHSAQL
jgi:hypothetical protein